MSHRRLRHLPYSLGAGSIGADLVLHAPALRGFADSDPVGTWPDLSGNANDGTATYAQRPTFNTNIKGGQPALTFNGTSNHMFLATPLEPSADYVVIFVGKKRTTGVNYVTLGYSVSDSNPGIFYTDDKVYSTSQTGFKSAPFLGTTSGIFAFVTTADDPAFWSSGSIVSLGGLFSYPRTPYWDCVGRHFASPRWTDGYMHELVMFGASISEAKLRRIFQSAGFIFRTATK